jgi:iron complex outermembrane receptor protein
MTKKFMSYAFGVTALVCSLSVYEVKAQEDAVLNIAPITVEAPLWSEPATSILNQSEGTGAGVVPYSDGADYLKNAMGVSAARFGGHGLEPFIRGQSQGQLNVVNGDAYTFGACPNRMDPPTAYMRIQPQDEITIVRGYQSVLNGFGGSGGSVIIDQNAPEFGKELDSFGHIEGGFDSNSEMWDSTAHITAGNDQAYASASAGIKSSNNYEDGNGNEVRSSFDERSGSFKLGYTPAHQHFYIGMDYHDIEDALFPGAGMDSPYSEGLTYKAGWEKDFDNQFLHFMKLSAYASLVDHRMDNFSLRPLSAPMALYVDSESDTYGIKWEADMDIAQQPFSTVLEWRRNNRNADRIVNNTGALHALLWPDITIDEVGLAAERTQEIGIENRLIYGGRYDYVHVDYGRAHISGAGNRTPNDIYRQFYGVEASTQDEHNFGGLIRFEHDYSDNALVYAGLSRSVRTADATERGLANFMGAGGANSWVGNPNIKPEKHHQFDTGFDVQQPQWGLSGSAYANIVQDYILRDSARAQSGISVNLPNADIYRNIDALLAGVEVGGSWDMTDKWRLEADATYTYGQDINAGQALPQIPPLQGKVRVMWQALDHLELGTNLRWAAQAQRVDTDSTTATGRDVGKTNGYAVFDLSATLTDMEPVSFTVGVNNVLDTRYASHLNRSNVSDPTEVQVYEAGRSFYLRMNMKF